MEYLGQILLLLLFILVPLFNAIMRRVTRALDERTAEAERSRPAGGHVAMAPAPPLNPRPPRGRVREVPPRVSIPPARREGGVRSVLPTAREARRGIILMTVLGPCRAFKPLD